ncbi:MAG: hypothetical protein DCC46_12780 [Armatimonadetes bacterium]|nr:MAG: hypothetical protein DCC46_12780 [Armatimonadota bacterium]
MFILYADEPKDPKEGESNFWIYGGIAVPAESLAGLSETVRCIKCKFEIPPEVTLKLSRPKGFTCPQWPDACGELVDEAIKARCVGFITVTHRDVARSGKVKAYSMLRHALFSRFNEFLMGTRSHGIAVLDNTEYKQDFKDINMLPLVGFNAGKKVVDLKRIHGYSVATEESSPLLGLGDIFVGTFHRWVNVTRNLDDREKSLRRIARLLWRGQNDSGSLTLLRFGLDTRPWGQWNPELRKVCDRFVADVESVAFSGDEPASG